jgi:hypothetical protein
MFSVCEEKYGVLHGYPVVVHFRTSCIRGRPSWSPYSRTFSYIPYNRYMWFEMRCIMDTLGSLYAKTYGDPSIPIGAAHERFYFFKTCVRACEQANHILEELAA